MPSPCTAPRRCRRILRRCPMSIPMPRRAAGWSKGVLGTFDSLNPLIVKGLAVQAVRGYRRRKPDGARLRRAVHALRPARAQCRDRRCAQLRHLHARSRGALFRRRAGDRRRTWSFPGSFCATTAGPTTAPIIPKSSRAEILGERTVRFDLDRQRRPRIAAHPRPDAGAAEACDRRRDLRGNDPGEADRQRPLCGRRRRCRQKRHLQARSQLLGPGASDQSRLVEFRRSALRLLPRRQRLFRSVQGGPLRRAQRERSEPLADAVTTFRPCATGALSRNRSRTACPS